MFKNTFHSAGVLRLLVFLAVCFGQYGFAVDDASATKKHKYTNRLIKETSPYLLQHAHNPVDWYPWGEEAFTVARAKNKPIFLSIGYSTCHWCHVMDRESFEDPAIAKIMNEHFVCIKVDREERPDVDKVYMSFVQASTGSGGWPLSVWLTPELRPFFGGTYFPPKGQHGTPGFPDLLNKITGFWKEGSENIRESSKEIMVRLKKQFAVNEKAEIAEVEKIMAMSLDNLRNRFDSRYGGFGDAPKFPHPVSLNFLFSYYGVSKDEKEREVIANMVSVTLRKMAHGGIYDHIGWGFHRYSVDKYWHVPHFEKMLYDQAQLVHVYLDAYQISKEKHFAETAREILEYVSRDMTAPSGGFYSAEDADSLTEHGGHEKAEGAFYVWTEKEIDGLLSGKEAELFKYTYTVKTGGNAANQSDPRGEFKYKNILTKKVLSGVARKFSLSEEEVKLQLEGCRKKLYEEREKRPKPHLDDKIITAWNGLMIGAFARGSLVLQEPKYLKRAKKAALFINKNLYSNAQLLRSHRKVVGKTPAFAEDYVCMIEGLIELYSASLDINWLKWAVILQKKQDELFWDPKGGAYFNVTDRDKSILMRTKDAYDGAIPSHNSIAALNLVKLGQMTGDSMFRKRAEKTFQAFGETLSKRGTAMARMLVAVNFYNEKPKQIIIAGKKDDASTREMLYEIHKHFIPHKVFLFCDGDQGQSYLAERIDFIKSVKPIDEKATAYICEDLRASFRQMISAY